MTELSARERQRSGEEADAWEEVMYVAAFGSGLVAAFPKAVAAGGLLGTPLGPLLFFGGLGFMGLRKRHAARRKQHDHRRDEPFEPTLAAPRTLDLASFGFDALGQDTARLMDAVERSAAFELAMVVANERALGARQAGLADAERARFEEALAFGSRATTLNLDVEHLADALAGALNDLEPLRLTADQVVQVHEGLDPGSAAAPRKQLDVLRKVGVDLDEEERATEPIAFSRSLRQGINLYGAVAMALRKAGRKTGTFALEYRQGHAVT